MARRTLLITLALAGLSACSWGYDGDYGAPDHVRVGFLSEPDGYAYRGRAWAPPRQTRMPFAGELAGPGLAILDDWLKETPEGRALVTLGFSDAGRGMVSEDTAHRANIWFRRYADQDRDMTLTDVEIRTALVAAAGRYLRR
jgi:hypothetical protein